jgi:hypothetical protein
MKSLVRVLLVGAIAALAIEPAAAQVPLTFRGGINLTNFIGGDASDTRQSQGLNLGLSMGLVRVSRVQLLAEVYYRQKGAVGSIRDIERLMLIEPQGMGLQEVEVGLDYVEIPVLARVNVGSSTGKFFPYVFGGPAFGWKVDCGVAFGDSSGQSTTRCDDLTQNLESTLRSYELGMVLGAGVDYALPRGVGALNLDARYTGGLSKIGEGQDALDIRNQAFTVMLGYSLGAPRVTRSIRGPR